MKKLSDEEIKTLRKDILVFLNKTREGLYTGVNRVAYQNADRRMNNPMLISLIMIIVCIYKGMSWRYTLSACITFFIFLFFKTAFQLIVSTAPQKDKDDYIWSAGKSVHVYFILTYILSASILWIIPWSDDLLHYKSNIQIAVLSTLLCSTLTSIIILIVASKPKYFLNKFITWFGTILTILTPLGGLSLFLFPLYFEAFNFTNLTLAIIYFVVCLGWIVRCISTINKNNGWNIIQVSVLKIVHPRRIINALPKTYKDLLRSQREALKITNKLEQEKEYEVEFYLLQLLEQKYPKRSGKFLAIIIGIITFIILNAIAGIIEQVSIDTFYVPYIQYFIKGK